MWPPRLFRKLLSKAMSQFKDEPRRAAAEKRALVVGLGNYGLRGTRHSVGMAVLNHLASQLNVGNEWKLDKRCCADVTFASLGDVELVLMKPRRFMNVNGLSVASAAEAFNLGSEDIYLVHDDLDKPLGKVALKVGGSARGHNGVRSCISSLRSDSMVRLRIGIGRPVGEAAVDRYVLSRFTSAEQEILPQVFEQAVELLLKHIQEKGRSQEMPDTCGEPGSACLETKGA